MRINFAKELRQLTVTELRARLHVKQLVNWYTFTSMLVSKEPTESETLSLLAYEFQNKKRPSFLTKLHQRLTTLRRDRERAEIGIC